MLLLVACSVMSHALAHNNYVTYGDPDGKPLPFLTNIALVSGWILFVISGIWLLSLAFLLYRFRRKPFPDIYVQIHTSSTLFIGVAQLILFLGGAALPSIRILQGLSR